MVKVRKTELQMIQGEYVSFVDGDNYIDADMYLDMLFDIKESQADFVHTGYFVERQGWAKEMLQYENGAFGIIDYKEKFLQEFLFGINR